MKKKTTTETSPTRLNRAIAAAGYCSRRKADELIFAGLVKVNGSVIRNPATRITTADHLEVQGHTCSGPEQKQYLLLYKPPQVICTVADPQRRTTVLELLPAELRKQRLYPVGRLDYFSEGLLLLTNDGDLAQKLMHPTHRQEKVYEVIVRGTVAPEQLQCMRQGMTIYMNDKNGIVKKLAPMAVQAELLSENKTRLLITITQGINRQIRRVCAQFNLVILSLKRIAEGPLVLGELSRGQFRPLTQEEISALKQEFA